MANIPEYKSRSPLNQPADQSQLARADLTQKIGQGVSGVLGQAQEMAFKAKYAQEQLDMEIYQKESALELESFVNKTEAKLRYDYAQNPKEAPDAFKKLYGEKVQELSKKAPFPSAQRTFTFAAKEMEIGQVDKLARWAADQDIKKLDNLQIQYSTAANTEIYRQPLLFDSKTKKYSVNKDVLDRTLMDQSALANQYQLTMDPLLVQKRGKEFRQSAVLSMFNGIVDEAGNLANQGKIKEANELVKAGQEILSTKDYDYDLGQDGVAKANRALKFAKQKNSAKAKDFENIRVKKPYEYLRKKFGVQVPDLNFSGSPEEVATSFAMRHQLREEATNKLLGGIKPPFFSENDDFIFKERIKTMPLDAQLKMFDGVAMLAPNNKQAFIEAATELKKYNPAYPAVVGLLSNGDLESRASARDILEGNLLMKKDPVTGKSAANPVSANEVAGILAKDYADVLGGPEQVQMFASAVQRAATKKMSEDGIDPKNAFGSTIKEKVLEQAKRLIGPAIGYNESKLLVPKDASGNYFNQYDFKKALREISNQTLVNVVGEPPAFASGKEAIIEAGSSYLQFRQAGEGQFRLYLQDPRTESWQPLFKKDKSPYILDMREYMKKNPPGRGVLDGILRFLGDE